MTRATRIRSNLYWIATDPEMIVNPALQEDARFRVCRFLRAFAVRLCRGVIGLLREKDMTGEGLVEIIRGAVA